MPYVGVSQNTFVPDDNFEQALIDLGLDSGPLNDSVPTINISGVDNLDLNNKNISDLKGIEDFRSLSVFDCSRNQLTNFNIQNNTQLTQLFCNGNQLTSIDVTQNSNLILLWCYTNLLSNVDVTQNPDMISLICWENNLTSINISNNPNLVVFGCEDNQITNLDLSKNVKLNRFQCRGNLLTSLDINNNSNLSYIDCGQNQITDLNLSNNNILNTLLCSFNELKALDLSQNPDLRNLECTNNKLCSLNVKNGNNDNIAYMNFKSNLDLNCVIVDEPDGDHSIWEPFSFSNYVISSIQCGSYITIDSLNNFTGKSYVLPAINNGNYFTEPGGMGIQLHAGDVISTSQTIYIYNHEGCNSNESKFIVSIINTDFFIPKYFTPNNDSNHDYWKVIDNANSIKSIYIYNRYGKLLKSLDANSEGWDGTFNGNPLTTDDYWFVINRQSEIPIKGHFTLKR
jgi:gliding motility-associated-like protein